MYYVVTESLKTSGGTADIDTYLTLSFDRPGGCPVSKVGEAHVTGRFTNNGGIIRFHGKFTIPYVTVCCRCLKEIEREADEQLDASFMRSVDDRQTGDDEIYIYEGSKLNLGDAVEDAFMLNLPYRDFCDGGCQNEYAMEVQ